jgi:prophage regulatory protein
MPNDSNENRLIEAAERRSLVPFSDAHIWRLEKAGLFPKRVKLGIKKVAWPLSEVLAWIEATKSKRG